jgi:LEA14-like dessication related protein
MRTRTIAVIIAVVVIVIAAAGATFLLTLQKPVLEGVSISSVDNVSSSGFNLTFVIKLYNPNVVGVDVKSVTYTLLLVESNQVLSTGAIDGVQIPAQGSVEIPIKSTVNFIPVISVAFQSIFSKSVMMNINGVATAHPLLIDAYPYISNAASKAV